MKVADLNALGGPKLLKVHQAQALLNVGNTKFYELVKAGKIPIVKIGRGSYVKTEIIDSFVQSLTAGPA